MRPVQMEGSYTRIYRDKKIFNPKLKTKLIPLIKKTKLILEQKKNEYNVNIIEELST